MLPNSLKGAENSSSKEVENSTNKTAHDRCLRKHMESVIWRKELQFLTFYQGKGLIMYSGFKPLKKQLKFKSVSDHRLIQTASNSSHSDHFCDSSGAICVKHL